MEVGYTGALGSGYVKSLAEPGDGMLPCEGEAQPRLAM